jgi:uncharacterized protein YbcV (DUF1398 family)
MAVNLSPVFGVAGQLFDNNGNPLAGGKIFTYLAGTTTNAPTYTSSNGSIAHSNPIILDGAGRVPSGEIWLTDGITYKFVVQDSANNLIGTYDNLTGINSNFVAFANQQEIQTATAGQTVFNFTTMTYQPGTNSLSVFVDGVNQYGPGAQYAYVETDSDTVTFVSGLHVGASVKFTTSQLNSSGAVDASQVTYNPPFTGSVVTNVEAKLSQYVSVKDFGAVGDGVVDDTAAIQTAINSDEGNVFFPAGVYRTTAPITMTDVTVSLYGEGKRFNTGIASEILIDHTGTGILISDKAHIGVFLQDLRFNRATAYFTQGANVSFDGDGPGPSDVVSHVNMLRVHIQGGAYGLLLRGVIFGAFDYVSINSALNGVVFNGAGSAFPANNVISFSQLSISGATTAAVTFQGNAGRNIMFFNCDIESNNHTVYFNPATNAENVVFDGLWLEDNTQSIVIHSGTQLYFKNIRNANNAGIELFDQAALENGTAQDVFVEGQYGGSTTHFAGAANVNAYNMRTSDAGGYSYAVTELTGSRANGSLIEPAVSGSQIMGTSVMDTVRQSGAFGKNYLVNWNIPGSTSWVKTGATGVQTEIDPLGGSTAYSWNGIVEGGRVTPPTIALGQFYEMVLWAKGAGVILLQNFGRPFYYNIDTASWTRLVFRVKITDVLQVMDTMAITLTPNSANGIQVWRPGIYDVMDAIDTRPSVQQSIYEGGYIDTAYTYGARERTNIIVYGTAIPVAGDWLIGDKVMNIAPTAGGVSGWVCTTAGTPGTWKSFGAIAA